MFIRLDFLHYWTMEIGNIFIDNNVTQNKGKQGNALGSYKQKNGPGLTAECPKIH